MSDEEFLARWSRRKREAKVAADAPAPAQTAETPNPASPVTAEDPANAELDLSSLPPIDSITAATDVTAFLRQGIPQDLSRAALRRAWAADPAIRDFVGLAENAWDFNDPHAMPGFGPLDCSEEQLGALVDRIVGGARSAADSPTTAIPEQKDASPSADSNHEPLLESRASEAVADLSPGEEISSDQPPPAPAAVQPEAPRGVESDQISPRRRTHGSALPR
ncbi:MAG TPA: DUF3306 domain-containing protein [Bradyrhizobium sp.]|nr:DUF3306 domain-containing protein [Bradyrhizobium sp.]